MANLRNIKDRINSIKNTQKITRAMKMVAAAKVRKAEALVRSSRPFTKELYKIFYFAYKQVQREKCEKVKTKNNIENYYELLQKREVNSVGVVVVSSNKGLAGAYCANIVRHSISLIKKFLKEGKKVSVYIIGQKAVPALKNASKELGFEIKKTYINILDSLNSSSAYAIASQLADDYVNKEIDSIELVTTRYKNMQTYITEDWQLLPVVDDDKRIREFHQGEMEQELNCGEYKSLCPQSLAEYLPDINTVLFHIVPMAVTNVIYQALLEAQASELASRMTAMSNATNNASEMINLLTVEYNKARQAKITQELTEIIAGANVV